jgi:hypothetical protein
VLPEVAAVHELHREESLTRGACDELVQSNQTRVAHVSERSKLLLELVEGGGTELRERLQRDAALSNAVERFVDDTYAAAADVTNEFIPGRSWPIGRSTVNVRAVECVGAHGPPLQTTERPRVS